MKPAYSLFAYAAFYLTGLFTGIAVIALKVVLSPFAFWSFVVIATVAVVTLLLTAYLEACELQRMTDFRRRCDDTYVPQSYTQAELVENMGG